MKHRNAPLMIAALPLLASALSAAWAGGGSCAYDEGILALERGHTLRAQTMLLIAAREGDPRARQVLRERFAGQRLAAMSASVTDPAEARRVDPAK